MESNIDIAKTLFEQNKYHETIESCNKILDSSGNSNKGMLIGDYKVKKVRKGEPMRRDSFIKVPKKTDNKKGAL